MPAFKLHVLCAAACALLVACGGGSGSGGTANVGDTANPGGMPPPESASDAVPDELVVKLNNAADLQLLLAEYELSLLDQFGRRPIYRLRAGAGSDIESLQERLSADPRVRYAEPNALHTTPEERRHSAWAIGGDAGVYATQWNTRALRLAEAHALSSGAGVRVAVLDTGVDARHPALAGRLVPGFNFVDFNADPSEQGSAGDPGYGHGTHVASLIAQVAPQARIMPIRVLDVQGIGNIWVLAEGLLHAVDPDGDPTTDDGAHVINLSLGTTRPTELLEDIAEIARCDDDDDDVDDDEDHDDDVVRCAIAGGAVVVSAAGNSGDETQYFPAAEERNGAIAVAASTEADTLASFSTRGSWVQVAAPGDQVYGAIPGSRWGVWSGTSMAAPMVAGAVALLRARYPQWEPGDFVDRLVVTGAALCGSPLKRIDAAAALGAAAAVPTPCR